MKEYFLVREIESKALFLCRGEIPPGYEFVVNVYDNGSLLPEYWLLRRLN